MQEIAISDDYLVLKATGSDGSQLKYYYESNWYKVNTVGAEDIAEELSTILLQNSSVQDFVSYSRCRVNGKRACVSKDFLKEGEVLQSFHTLYNMYTGKSITDAIFKFEEVQDRFDFLCNFFEEIADAEFAKKVRAYLSNVFALDMLTLNPDRHFSNLFIIQTENGSFRTAPIFDNGQALGCNWTITEPMMYIDECIDTLKSCSISGSFESQYMVSDKIFKIDYGRLMQKLEKYEDCRAKKLLMYNLNKYKSVFSLQG